MQIPEQKILEVIKLEKDTKGLIMQGANAGEIGKINEIKEGTFVLPKRVDIKIGDRQIEIPATLVMPVGKGEPPIQIR
jgi:small subunit ribosomal protein S4e